MKKIKHIKINSIVYMVALAGAISLAVTRCGVSETKLTYPQVATGQVLLYDADGAVVENINPGDSLYGQDAHYLTGAKMSYKNNGDGTISDLNTGLMWQMIPVDQGFDWQGASDYCENLELAGYDDWRLPSAKELYSISDFSTGWPYINTEYFKLINNERIGKDEQYWTSHVYVGTIGAKGSSTAFGVNHGTGHIKAYGAGNRSGEGEAERPQRDSIQGSQGERPQRDNAQGTNTERPQRQQQGSQGERPQRDSIQGNNAERPQVKGNRSQKYVRAVRGNAYGINNFKDNGDGTISDNATGLMWSQADSKKGMDWVVALKYAEESELAGYSDWRLPNVKELQGILNYNFAPGATDPTKEGAAIDPMFDCSEIVNENGDKDYPYFWTSTSALFQKGRPYYYAWYVAFGRAVSPTGIDSHGAGAVRFDTKYEGGPSGEDGARFYNYVRLVRNIK
ncbi:MAG: DUF1566 domain-containing protein [Rikenellaceae bacterium]